MKEYTLRIYLKTSRWLIHFLLTDQKLHCGYYKFIFRQYGYILLPVKREERRAVKGTSPAEFLKRLLWNIFDLKAENLNYREIIYWKVNSNAIRISQDQGDILLPSLFCVSLGSDGEH